MLISITNTPRPYAWGSTTAIPELLGSETTGDPQAELWLGSHPGSPARIVQGAPEADLLQWAAAHAPDGRLPFLLKVLAASAPLSLQVHPTTAQARVGFARENAAGIPVDAPDRNYRDPFAKPELIVALSDSFRALCGFRPVAESRVDLSSLDDDRLAPLLERLTGDRALADVVRWLLERGDGAAAVVDALSERALSSPRGEREPWLDTARMLALAYPADPGIAISTLMHTVLLGPGEALYLPAGNIHAYLEGLGIELMAPSDNVLRGGLTGKHIDVPELLAVLDTRPLPAPRLAPEAPAPGVALYAPDDVELSLALIEPPALAAGLTLRAGPEAILLVLDGSVSLGAGRVLERGQAALVADESLLMTGEGRLVIASSRLEITEVAGS